MQSACWLSLCPTRSVKSPLTAAGPPSGAGPAWGRPGASKAGAGVAAAAEREGGPPARVPGGQLHGPKPTAVPGGDIRHQRNQREKGNTSLIRTTH